jgi:hypothetical protein
VRLRLPLLLAVVATVVAGALTAGAGAAGPHPFTSASKAAIRPGAMMVTAGAQCTANFFFTDRDGSVLVGQAAHCTSLDGPRGTNGCTARSRPLGTPVEIDGALHPGTLVYSSWIAMQRAGERDRNACQYNDFALVRLHPDDVRRSNPTVPLFGGPNGLDRDGTRFGEPIASWGNSSLRLGIRELSPKRGYSLGSFADRWTHDVYTATPGIPGDSGSGVLDVRGNAIGTLSTLALAPLPASNGVSGLQRQMAYARLHGAPDLTLIPGTVPFKGVLALR